MKDRVPEGMVKADVVNFAKSKWPLIFSKFYEATQISGTVKVEKHSLIGCPCLCLQNYLTPLHVLQAYPVSACSFWGKLDLAAFGNCVKYM